MAGRSNHGPYLANLLGDAKKGCEDRKTKIQPGTSLTAEQVANAQNILSMIGKNVSPNSPAIDHYHSPEIVFDINGERRNPDNGPFYYKHKATETKRVLVVPYKVSDTFSGCHKCARHRACDRHRRPPQMKTDISLCTSNHVRMVLIWDVGDPENRNGSWSLSIEEHSKRFFNPDRERREHEASVRKWKEGEEKKDEQEDGEHEGCHPLDPSRRIKELVKRIIEDHNADQKDKAHRAYLDPKGREYTTRSHHWGLKDPFVSAAAAATRAG